MCALWKETRVIEMALFISIHSIFTNKAGTRSVTGFGIRTRHDSEVPRGKCPKNP